MISGVGAAPMGGMLGSLWYEYAGASLEYEYVGASLEYEYAGASLEYEYAGTSLVVDEEADSAGRSESVMVLIVPPIGNDGVSVSVTKDTEYVGVVVSGASDEPIMYPPEVEVASEAEVEVASGIGENGWVVNVTRLGAVTLSCATELSETSVVEHSVGVTITVVVKRVVNLPFAASDVALVQSVLVLSEASVAVEVEHVVETVGESVISVPLKVEFAATAESAVVVGRLSDKASPSGMLIPGMSAAAGVLVAVGRQVEELPVSTALVVVVATNVLETSPLSPSLWLWLSTELSPLIPPFAPVSSIQAWASSWAAHEMV